MKPILSRLDPSAYVWPPKTPKGWAPRKNKEQRLDGESYYTPRWLARGILDAVELPGGNWLEPTAGAGHLIQHTARQDVQWTAVDPLAAHKRSILRIAPQAKVHQTRLERWVNRNKQTFQVTFANFPFLRLFPMTKLVLPISEHMLVLMRLQCLTSIRHDIFRVRKPDVYIVPDTVEFLSGMARDKFMWVHFHANEASKYTVLPQVPRGVRANDLLSRQQKH